MTDQRDDIINFIKYNGPVLPVQIAKHVNTNILFSSAMLSELAARKILKITHAAIGGSPLYYLPGQEDLMDARLSASLSGREKEAYLLLRDNKILGDNYMEPWQRVAVRNLKDFAVQINVNSENENEIFWKHILITDEEAKMLISNFLEGSSKPIEHVEENISLDQYALTPENDNIALEDEKIITQPEELEIVKEVYNKDIVQETVNTIISGDPAKKQKEVKKKAKIDDNFYERVLQFIKKSGAEILKEEIIKKDKEIDFLLNIPSNFGSLRYFVKAKNKPLINESDISMAFSEGQIKKLPVVLLMNGKTNKKAAFLVEQKMLGQLTLKEI